MMNVSMMHVSMILDAYIHDACMDDAYIYDPWSLCICHLCIHVWCIHPWSLILDYSACVCDAVCRYVWSMSKMGTNGRTDGKLNSRSRIERCSGSCGLEVRIFLEFIWRSLLLSAESKYRKADFQLKSLFRSECPIKMVPTANFHTLVAPRKDIQRERETLLFGEMRIQDLSNKHFPFDPSSKRNHKLNLLS